MAAAVGLMNPWWSWTLAAVGLTGLYLAGRRLAAGWAIGVAAQVLWLAYGLITAQWGFTVSACAYAAINIRNLIAWSRPVCTDTEPEPEPATTPVFARLTSTLTPNQRGALPGVIVCDLDGTLCLHTGRSPYDDSQVLTDAVNGGVAATVRAHHKDGAKIIFVSGRFERARADTQLWLERHLPGIPYQLHMRADGDTRNDAIVKYEIYRDHIFDKAHVIAVLDDRDRVVAMWRAVGLRCYQVNYGDF